MSYEEWEAEQKFSPVSPEAHFAELAWRAAMAEARRVVASVGSAEATVRDTLVLIDAELEQLS